MHKKIILKHFFSKHGKDLVFEFYHPLYDPKINIYIRLPQHPETFFGMVANMQGECRFCSALAEFSQRYNLHIINEQRLIKQAYDYLKANAPGRLLVNYLVFTRQRDYFAPQQLQSVVDHLNTGHLIVNIADAKCSIKSLNFREIFIQANEYKRQHPGFILQLADFMSSYTSGRGE
jgi:hypothetical protein